MTTPLLHCEVSVLTAPGQGAIGSLGIRGPGASWCIEQHFNAARRRAVADFVEMTPIFGRWSNGEQLVLCRLGPESYELHCHGGPIVIRSLVDSLKAVGCQAIAPGQWTADPQTPIRSAAHQSLVQTQTRRTAGMMLDQCRGALEAEIVQALRTLAGDDVDGARQRLESLLRTADLGPRLTTGWVVAFIGDPNVGKSSLVNALVGFERSIVFHEPGTTRDVLAAHTVLQGWPVTLLDTAGVRDPADTLEQIGIQSGTRASRSSDLIVVVSDQTRRWTPFDQQRLEHSSPVLVVHNKSDDPRASTADRPAGLSTSALSGAGIADLVTTIARRLVPFPPAAGSGILFTADQIAHVAAARGAIDERQFARASELLEAMLTGPHPVSPESAG